MPFGEEDEIAFDLFHVLTSVGNVDVYDDRGRRVADPRAARRFFVPRAGVHVAIAPRGDAVVIDVLADIGGREAKRLYGVLRRFGRSRGAMVRLRTPPAHAEPPGPLRVLAAMAGIDDPARIEYLCELERQPRVVGLARAILSRRPPWREIVAAARRIDPLLGEVFAAAGRAPDGRRVLARWLRRLAAAKDGEVRR